MSKQKELIEEIVDNLVTVKIFGGKLRVKKKGVVIGELNYPFNLPGTTRTNGIF